MSIPKWLTWTALALAGGLSLIACSGEDDNAPAIPHSITSTAESYCLSCHKEGVNGAPKTPHPDRTGCTGCHAPSK